MHPQRNVITAAQMINEIALVTKDEGPRDYDYDKHQSDLDSYIDSDEHKEMRKKVTNKGIPNFAVIDQINKKRKDLHPMGHHIQNAATEIDNYRLGTKYQEHSGSERLDNIRKIAYKHFNEYKETMRDHPHYGPDVDHHQRMFIEKLGDRTSR